MAYLLTSSLEFQSQVLKDDKLRDCINRLRGYANQENLTIDAEDADGVHDSIVDDLKYVLAVAKGQCNESARLRSLKRIDGLFSSAQMLSINRMGKIQSNNTTFLRYHASLRLR